MMPKPRGQIYNPMHLIVRASGQLTVPLLLAASVACGPDEPLRVETTQLGRSRNPDNSVAMHTTSFKPEDTIYISILTANPGAGHLSVRWMHAGLVVNESSKDVSYRGPAATEFHLVNSSGFPAGEYNVEVLLDGRSVAKRNFRVDK